MTNKIKKIKIIEEAFPCGMEGNGFNEWGLEVWFQARGEDEEGNEYKLIWIPWEDWEDYSDMDVCDWYEPYVVVNEHNKMLEEGTYTIELN